MKILDLLRNDPKVEGDPLVQFMEQNPNLLKLIYPSFLNDLVVEESYTTKHASEYIGKSDGNIRYYIRELGGYIKPFNSGRSYRFDYKSLFRLHLIATMIDNGYTVQDIAVKARLKSLIDMNVEDGLNNSTVPSDITHMNKLFASIKNRFEYLEEQSKEEKLAFELKYLEQKIATEEQKFKTTVSLLENKKLYFENELGRLQMAIEIEKLNRVVESRVERSDRQTVAIYKRILEKKKGFWGNLFSKNDIDESELLAMIKEQRVELPVTEGQRENEKKIKEIGIKIASIENEIEKERLEEEKRLLELKTEKGLLLEVVDSKKMIE